MPASARNAAVEARSSVAMATRRTITASLAAPARRSGTSSNARRRPISIANQSRRSLPLRSRKMTSRSDSSQSQTHVSASDIEREVQRRLEFATERYKREISDLRETIKVLEFRAAVAEWAVSGVLARNLSLRVAIDPDRKSTRLNSSHSSISYAVFCL